MSLKIGIGGNSRIGGGASSADAVSYNNTDSGLQSTNVQGAIDEVANLSKLQKVTYAELKNLRDNSQLIPGCWYRMTDYETIVAPSKEYKSAGHQFDLIILATDINKLSEDCKACRHEGDTYFPEDTNFEAWEVKYCIDNDVNNYDWVNDKNSKGIIYNLKDDRNNICGYDFKNILFKRYEIKSNLLKESKMSNLLNFISKDPTITIDFDTIMTNKQGFLGLFTTEQTGFDINTEDYKYFYTFCLYNDINDKVIDTTVFPTLMPVTCVFFMVTGALVALTT